jgi:bacterioferritin
MSGNDRDHAGSPAGTGAGSGTGTASGGIGPSPTASLAGDAEVIRLLNVALKNELTAINQYFLHSRMLADWGVSILAHKEYEESVDEMKHADRLIKRVLFLGGLPNLQDLGKLKIGENVREIIDCDLALEMDALGTLKAGVAHSESAGDYVSRELFKDILESEEEHIDFLQTQVRLIEQIGIENYIQMQSKPHGS